jgi:hypothetical protein
MSRRRARCLGNHGVVRRGHLALGWQTRFVSPLLANGWQHSGVLRTDFLDNSEDGWGNYARRLDVDMLQKMRAAPHPTIPTPRPGSRLHSSFTINSQRTAQAAATS